MVKLCVSARESFLIVIETSILCGSYEYLKKKMKMSRVMRK